MLRMPEEAALMLCVSWWERKRLQAKQKGLASFPSRPPPSCLPFSCPIMSGNKRCFRVYIPCASKNSSSELSSESLAMLCILHSEILWREGLAAKNKQALCDTQHWQDAEFPTWSLLEEVLCSLWKLAAAMLKTQNPDDAGVMSVCCFTDPVCLLLWEPDSEMLH